MILKSSFVFTNDKIIRTALKTGFEKLYDKDPHARIIEELGITHGAARVDIAVVNGVLHGYELKSDLDNLLRLPEQIRVYNSVLDQVTLVVGKSHVYDAIKLVPEWWGVMIAKIVNSSGIVSFYDIREPGVNPLQNSIAIARLLWREEALGILEKNDEAKGMRYKPRKILYEKLAYILDQNTLKAEVRQSLISRTNWRSENSHMLSGD